MFKKKGKNTDHGMTLPYKCSNCASFGFNLKEAPYHRNGQFFIHALLSGWGKNRPRWSFECANCYLAIDIPNAEIEECIKLNKNAKEYQSGKLVDKEFMGLLSSSKSTVVQEIYNRCNLWECEKCQNEVPPTFEVCWNCGAECPTPEKLIDIKGTIQLNSFVLTGSSYEFKKEEEKE